jgi:hypothetical protein
LKTMYIAFKTLEYLSCICLQAYLVIEYNVSCVHSTNISKITSPYKSQHSYLLGGNRMYTFDPLLVSLLVFVSNLFLSGDCYNAK